MNTATTLVIVLDNTTTSTKNSDPQALHTVKDGYLKKWFGITFSHSNADSIHVIPAERDQLKPCVTVRELFGQHGSISMGQLMTVLSSGQLKNKTCCTLVRDQTDELRVVTIYWSGMVPFINARFFSGEQVIPPHEVTPGVDLISTDCYLVVPK